MELTPKNITSVEFQLVRKGYDPDEVRAFLNSLGKSVEAMQTQLANADARARAAVQRMQEVSAQQNATAGGAAATATANSVDAAVPSAESVAADSGQAETIARTLLLAQRTADATVADAEERSRAIIAGAEDRSRSIVDEAENRAAQIVRAAEDRSVQMIERARTDAVQAHAGEASRIQAEVHQLTSQRTDLHQTIDTLSAHVVDQRSRLANAADVLRSLLADDGVLAAVAPPAEAAVDPVLDTPVAPVPPPPSAVPSWMSGFGAEDPTSVATEPLAAGEAPVQANQPLVIDAEAVVVDGRGDHLPGFDDDSVDVPSFTDVRWAADDD